MSAETAVNRQPSLMSTSAEQFVTFRVGNQNFGIPALKVRDVLREQPLTRVPLAPTVVSGAINLRGHIVIAVDVRARLGVTGAPVARPMCVVVESRGEAVCLIVDAVGDVVTVENRAVLPNPGSLPANWAELSRGVHRLNDHLLLLLDVDQLLSW
jgi:purine-binding chemotaxis protein CheW